MRRAAALAIATLATGCIAGAAFAEGDLSVGLNQSRRVVLHGTAASVIISDPHVADVAMVDAHDLILLGRGYGATDVIVLDRAGRTLMNSHVMVSAPESGRVTIHRGGEATEFACTPRCQSLATHDGAAQAPGAASAGAAAPLPTTNGATSMPQGAPAASPGV